MRTTDNENMSGHDAIYAKLAPEERRFGPRIGAAFFDGEVVQTLGQDFQRWLAIQPLVIQKPHRCAHKAIEHTGMTVITYDGTQKCEVSRQKLEESTLQVVRVEHDWGALLQGADVSGPGAGEWRLPYDEQIFEFAINGAAVCVFAFSDEGRSTMTLLVRPPFNESWVSDRCTMELFPDRWAHLTNQHLPKAGNQDVNAGLDRLYDFIFKQIRATSIMLDAEVAVVEPVRAPYLTNRPPKAGKPLPPLSHHVVSLSRKSRAAPLPSTGTHSRGGGVRLHFRRGHWRHYSSHKTWIKWMLVGNSSLGFVAKEYSA